MSYEDTHVSRSNETEDRTTPHPWPMKYSRRS